MNAHLTNTNSPWWKEKWSKENICCITLSRLRPGKNKQGIPYVIKLSACKHRFYRKALIHWIQNSNNNNLNCPICKQTINLNDISK